jgi:hypothetical protein
MAALALAGCGGFRPDTGASQAPCPRIAILADGADLTRFRPGGTGDLAAMVIDARITGFDARCDFVGRGGAVEVRLTPRFEAERGPAAEGRSTDLPWFVALTDAEDTTLLAREAYATRMLFPSNVARSTATGPTARVVVPEGVRVADTTLRVSLQLTPEELALNRRRGPR